MILYIYKGNTKNCMPKDGLVRKYKQNLKWIHFDRGVEQGITFCFDSNTDIVFQMMNN